MTAMKRGQQVQRDGGGGSIKARLATYNEFAKDHLLMIMRRVVMMMGLGTLSSSARGAPSRATLIITPFVFQFSPPAISRCRSRYPLSILKRRVLKAL